ncbi:MAG: carbohydrate kinase [Bacteroidetes bacterium]|nr:carbohydrate kinase [Bacteroidota bacterium]
MNALAFGEILWDIIEGKPYIGGAPFNLAAHLAKCGADSYMISRVGNDELGLSALEETKSLSVNDTWVQVDNQYATGTVDVFLQDGQPTYTIYENVAYDFIDYQEFDQQQLKAAEFKIFYFGTLAQRNKKSRETLYQLLSEINFSLIFYDVNLRQQFYSREIIENSLHYSTILKLNHEEVEILSNLLYEREFSIEEFSRKLVTDFNQQIIITTAAEKGCMVFADGEFHTVAGKKVEVVDAVGAGDSFSAAFLYKYFQVGDPVKAAFVANQIGAFVASSRGAVPIYPDYIKELLNN